MTRRTVAGLGRCPADLLAALCGDPSAEVRRRAAGHNRCASEDLVMLARDEEPVVRDAVAANRSCPEESLAELASDEHAGVRASSVANLSCPPAVVDDAAGSHIHATRLAALSNPRCPPQRLTDVAEEAASAAYRYDPSRPGSQVNPIWRAAATNASTAPSAVALFAHCDDLEIQAAAVQHPNCPVDTVERLAASPYLSVSVPARKRLGRLATAKP